MNGGMFWVLRNRPVISDRSALGRPTGAYHRLMLRQLVCHFLVAVVVQPYA